MMPYNAARLCLQLGRQARQHPLGIASANEVCGMDTPYALHRYGMSV